MVYVQGRTVLAAYGRLLLRTALRLGVPAEQILTGLPIDRAAFDEPFSRLPLSTMLLMIERARALTHEPALGWYLGLESRVSLYGPVGFGILSAATLRQALELLGQYGAVMGTVLSFRLEVEGPVAALVIEENVDCGSSRDVVLGGTVVAAWQIGFGLTGSTPTGSADMAIPEPAYFPRVAHLGPPVRFKQPATRIVFDAAKLDLPLILADSAANRLAQDLCEREMVRIGGGFSQRILRFIEECTKSGNPSMRRVAATMHVSPSTLKRRLAERGTKFSGLLSLVRRDRAMLLLRSSSRTIEEIAQELGYSTTSNFSRAFCRWTGESPAAYRRGQRERFADAGG